MLELSLLILSIVALLGAILGVLVVLKSGIFRLHIRTGEKKDVLLVETEHQGNNDCIDK